LPNAKKKPSDDVTVVEALQNTKVQHGEIPLLELIRASSLTDSSYFRYHFRLGQNLEIVQKSGRKCVEIDYDEYTRKAFAGKKCKGYRRRLSQWKRRKTLSPYFERMITERAIKEYNAQARLDLHEVKYWEPHQVWAMDISEYSFDGHIFEALQVIDLGSGIKFEAALKLGTFCAKEVAEHLAFLMHKYGAPLFLKRDNGGNLKAAEVQNVLQQFVVLPLNSPPHCPQYNGSVERAQGELKIIYHRQLSSDDTMLNAAKGYLSLAISQSNMQPKRRFHGRTPLQMWSEPYRKFDKWRRSEIYQETKNHALRILNGAGHQVNAQLFDAAWRVAARCTMEKMHMIEIYRHREKVVCNA